jgi:hypothetical protein
LLAPLRSAGEPVPGPTISPDPAERQTFIPPTYREGDRVVMPVTFPDGSTAELVYPPHLDLASMGVRPYIVGCGRDFNFFYRYDPYEMEYDGDRPLGAYQGAEGSEVTLWKGRHGVDLYLRFRFGDWTVLMYDYTDGLTERQRAACTRAVHGRQTTEGFLVLSMPNPPPSLTPLAESGRTYPGPSSCSATCIPGSCCSLAGAGRPPKTGLSIGATVIRRRSLRGAIRRPR